jgi:hypothetical protein
LLRRCWTWLLLLLYSQTGEVEKEKRNEGCHSHACWMDGYVAQKDLSLSGLNTNQHFLFFLAKPPIVVEMHGCHLSFIINAYKPSAIMSFLYGVAQDTYHVTDVSTLCAMNQFLFPAQDRTLVSSTRKVKEGVKALISPPSLSFSLSLSLSLSFLLCIFPTHAFSSSISAEQLAAARAAFTSTAAGKKTDAGSQKGRKQV